MKRKKPQAGGVETKTRERILIFDLFRILCVAIIVYDHVRFFLIPGFNQFFFADGYGPFNIYTNGLQGYAVYGMILISGAVLEYNYQGLEKLHGYLKFLFKRFIRLYPAFWLSLIFSLIAYPLLFQVVKPVDILLEFTGFFVVLGQGPGYINPMGWFIAAIFSLYILFPWFSRIVRKYHIYAMIALCIISWGLRFLAFNFVPVESFWRWFPLCNAFEFCLGIYLIQQAWYPKTENTSPLVRELSDLSFFVFLFHVSAVKIFRIYFESTLVPLDTRLALGNALIGSIFFYFQMLLAILVVSWIAMKIDTWFRTWLLQRDAVRNFLNA
ncbi:MAG: acyltransferase [Methanoregula sp.]|nr:acyltransferase [Methanoregula sp.]